MDLILGGLGLTGLILLCALLVGGMLGALFIWFKHVRPLNPLNGQASQTHGLQLGALFETPHDPGNLARPSATAADPARR